MISFQLRFRRIIYQKWSSRRALSKYGHKSEFRRNSFSASFNLVRFNSVPVTKSDGEHSIVIVSESSTFPSDQKQVSSPVLSDQSFKQCSNGLRVIIRLLCALRCFNQSSDTTCYAQRMHHSQQKTVNQEKHKHTNLRGSANQTYVHGEGDFTMIRRIIREYCVTHSHSVSQ